MRRSIFPIHSVVRKGCVLNLAKRKISKQKTQKVGEGKRLNLDRSEKCSIDRKRWPQSEPCIVTNLQSGVRLIGISRAFDNSPERFFCFL